jgi:hypothetical protein
MRPNPNTTIPTTVGDEPTMEERWTRWVAKGAAVDRGMRARLRYLAILVVAGLLAWGALVLLTR